MSVKSNPIRIHYASTANVAKWRSVVLRNVELYYSNKAETYPEPSIRLSVIDIEIHKPRTFRAERILEIVDEETGEFIEKVTFFGRFGCSDRVIMNATPLDVGRFRTIEHGLSFGDKNKGLHGWCLHVPDAFRDSLDLIATGQRREYSQGWPPAYRFRPGDVLYDTPLARQLPWGEALAHMKHMVEIVSAIQDQPDNLNPAKPGKLVWNLTRVKDGNLMRPEKFECTQRDFVNFIKTGYLFGKPYIIKGA